VRALGFIAPPGPKHWFIDNFWGLLARLHGKGSYLGGVKTTHMHPLAGKAEADATYRDQPDHEADRLAWAGFLAGEYQQVRKRLA
jgi:hypothetical protein